jgi:hypothetical protein
MIRLTDKQLGYLACAIDAEGTIGITYYTSKSGRPRFQVRVSSYNSDRRFLDYIHGLVGGYIHHRRRDKGIHNWKDMYTWFIEAQKAKEFLLLIKPELIIKKQQAEVALEMLETYLDKQNNVYGCKGFPGSLSDKRMSLKNRMHELNRKGRGIVAKGVNSEKPLLNSEVTPNQAESNNSLACVETNGHPPKGMI